MSNMEQALKQDREFIASLIRQIPSMPVEVKQYWIENPKDLKKFLSGLCSPEEVARCLGELKMGTALPARNRSFDPQVPFNKRGVLTSSGFDSKILAYADVVASVPETPVSFYNLVKDVNDAGIQAELLEGHIFDSLETFLPFLAGLIDRQPKGESGDLLDNGYANIFYVRTGSGVLVVRARRYSDDSGWICSAYRLGDSRWVAGSRVFSATAVA